MAPLDKTELAVGDSARLEVFFSTGLRLGRVTKAPAITTSFSTTPFYVQIRAEIFSDADTLSPLNISPVRLLLVSGNEPDDGLADFTLHNSSDRRVQISLIDSPDDLLTVSVPHTIAAHQAENGRVMATNHEFTEPFHKSLTIEVDSLRRFTIPVVGAVLP